MDIDHSLKRPSSAPSLFKPNSSIDEIKEVVRSMGGSESFVHAFSSLLEKEKKDVVMNNILAQYTANADNLMSKRVDAMDVQVVTTTRQDIKDEIISHFDGYKIKFRDLTTSNDSKLANDVGTSIQKFDQYRMMKRPTRPYAITQHPKSHVMRQTLEALLVRYMDINERFLTIGVGYESFMRRGLKCHCCFPLFEVGVDENGNFYEDTTKQIPRAHARISRAEHSLRKHVRTLLRENPGRLNSVLAEFSYSGAPEPEFYEDTGLRYRCFRPPELCMENARQAITMFTAREYSLERLVRIMHVRGVEILYGAEALSKSMLRFSSGRMEMFEQDFIIDMERDEMRVYNKDEANDYVYKYSTLRQFFFEQDIVHKGYVYAYRHEYVTSDVLVYTLRKLPLGTKPVRHSPVVDIRDDFVFLKTYVLDKTWNRHSTVPVQPLILSCHRIIYNQVKNHLVSIEKPDDEYLITTKRYLRTLNSEFVVNGKTYMNFEKLPAECFDQIAIALLIEALKEKMATNTLVQKVFEETHKAFERKPFDKFAVEVFYKKIKDVFSGDTPLGELAERFSKAILNRVQDSIFSANMLLEFFSMSHFIDNPYDSQALGTYANVPLTPYETMWFYHYKDGDISNISWFQDLLKFDPEPDFSILEDVVNDICVDDLFAFNESEFGSENDQRQSNLDHESQVLEDEVDSIVDSLVSKSRERQSSIFTKDSKENVELTSKGLSEIPEMLEISDIGLPVLHPESVTNAKQFISEIKKNSTLREMQYAKMMCHDKHSATDHDKAIFEAYVYRKDTAACEHNTMCKEAMTMFYGPEKQVVKSNLDSPQKRNAGYNLLFFKAGKEVDRYFKTEKKYSVGYLPYDETNLRPCYQLTYNTVTRKHEIKMGQLNYSGAMLVSDLTVVMNDENIATALMQREVNFDWPEMVLISAGAGCGKTHFTVKNFSPNNFYVGSTRKVVSDLRSKLKSEYENTFPSFDFDLRVRTCDSLTVNGLPKMYVEDLYVDECYQSQVGELLRVVQLVSPKRVIYLGDPLQIRFIDRLAIRVMDWSTNLEHFINRKITLSVSRRCPQDTARLLSDRFYLKDPLFGEKFMTTSEIRYSMKYDVIHSESQVPLYEDVLYMTFTRADAFQLNEYFRKCTKGSRISSKGPKVEVIDGEIVRTVHTGQGMDVNHVILVRLSRYMDEAPMSRPHQLVALSRHKVSLRYMTVLDDDPIVDHIKYASDVKAPLHDYYIPSEKANKITNKDL